MINLIDLLKAIINTLVRLAPLSFYTGSIISGALFSDFRAVLLLGGFIMNEALSLGYRMIFKGVSNIHCSLVVSADDNVFVLPSPITQTFGFLFGFILADMYYTDTYSPFKFFIMLIIVIIAIYSRINIGCKTILDAVYCALIGTMLGVVYYSLIKDIYRPDYFRLDATLTSIDDKIANILK